MPVFQSPTGFVGVGLIPIGLKQTFVASRARFYGAVSGGLIQFNGPVPSRRAQSLNFSGDYAVGLEVPIRGGASVLTAAWKFQHWSNGGTARSNPGIDANLLVVGFKSRRR